jgi:hypothetical protein
VKVYATGEKGIIEPFSTAYAPQTKFLVLIAVVVVLVPIAVSVPLMVVFVPPTMICRVAALTLLMQLVSPVVGLAAVSTVMLDGFV